MKFASAEYEIKEAEERYACARRELFKALTGTKKAVHLTYATTYGVKRSARTRQGGGHRARRPFPAVARRAQKPLFAEGAAKTHFGWHVLSGANAFDCFPPVDFKRKLVKFPLAQAPSTWQDIFEVMRRREKIRAERRLMAEEKRALADPAHEHHAYLKPDGTLEIVTVAIASRRLRRWIVATQFPHIPAH